MLEYPADEVDRILTEEVQRQQGTDKWYAPYARTRITALLLERLCASWSVPVVREALEALTVAERHLLYKCTEKDVAFSFDTEAFGQLSDILQSVARGLALTLAARPHWPDPTSIGTADDIATVLKQFQEASERWDQTTKQTLDQNGHVVVRGDNFVEMHSAISVGYAVFLTADEFTVFSTQMKQALERLGEYQPLFESSDSDKRPS